MNRLHPFSALVYAVQYAFLWLWVPVFLIFVLGGVFDPISPTWFPFVAALGFVAGIAYGIAYYYRFGYRITDDTFDVASGVIARRDREIPYRRIQNVDIRQGVFQRLVGLAVVSIETAGGGSTEATLSFVGEEEATRLQNEIRRRTAEVKGRSTDRPSGASEDADETGMEASESSDATEDVGTSPADVDATGDGPTDVTDEPAVDSPDRGIGPGPGAGESIPGDRAPNQVAGPQREGLFDLEARELLLYSFTSFRPAAVAGVLFVFFFMTDTIIEFFLSVAEPLGGPADLETGTASSYGILTLVSFVNGVVITYLLSVAYTFATYYDFQLGRVADDFVYERGLLQRYSGSIPAEKVQSVTITDNPAQRLLGYAGLWVETAGYGPDSNGGSQSAVPLAESGRVYGFTENLTGIETPRFRSPPTVARRRYFVRYSLVAAALVALAFGLTRVTVFERWYLAAVAFVAVPAAAHLRYVNLGYYVGDEHLVVRRGFWRRRTTVIPYYRIQTVNTRRSIFQRRLGLASVVIDTASSRTLFWSAPTIYDVELEDGRDVHATSRDRLQTALRKRSEGEVGLSVDFT
ncbi:PH domain-containing protein [Halopiger goleimassiliensis]|uniref:PH domain-containing protein n=1 Tax=Halopiger goleimassiliensis TaxID=1293048 RepID=UPI000677AE4C|nr:PH domain-containing protein [Halopiger goleimassiliensis]